MSAFESIGKRLAAVGRGVRELFHMTKLLISLLIAASVFGTALLVYMGVANIWNTMSAPLSVFRSRPVPANLPEVVGEQELKCRAYTAVVDFEGAPRRLEVDKVRIIKTVASYKRLLGVSACDVFERQMELVTPGSGRRSVFDRRLWYVEKEFGESATRAALFLAKELSAKPDLSWEPIVIIRPKRRNTLGNQTSAEIRRIQNEMREVNVGDSDFRFFALKK